MLSSVNSEIHGITRSKELIDMLLKCGICISYNNLQLLYTTWAFRVAETSKTCPRATAYGKPPIVIVNNDDLKINILIGNATGAHGTNALYVLPKSYEEERNHNSATAQTTERVIKKECAIN